MEPDAFCRDDFRSDLLNDDFQNVFETVTAEQADVNFDGVKANFNRGFSAQAVIDWNDAPKNFSAAAVKSNAQILTDYIDLCLANGAKPVGVVLPVAPVVRKNFDAELLKTFRNAIHQLEETHDFTCVDMFELVINYDSFCDMTHLNARGQTYVTEYFATKLHVKNLIPIESFCNMNYDYFNNLSNVAPKDDYNAFMEKVFVASAEMIRRKDKIKVAFVVRGSAEWCGDDLYNIFARNERFETTVFLCLRTDNNKFSDLVIKDSLHGMEKFKSHGLNVVALDDQNINIPAQDVFIFLTPYFYVMPNDLQLKNLTPKTLITHIPYSLDIAVRSKGYYNYAIFRIGWKIFYSSVAGRETYAKYNTVGMPRGFFSGYPRTDVFFKPDVQFTFDWKLAQPDAKKIIWAPHWSIERDVKYSTFQWNFKFMYEFAKAHPETSWVVKPHPGLFAAAVEENVFESVAAFEEYLRAWNDLPNAQVVVGAYYEAIFATSDGMIHDSDTFIAEYQYVDKPMIFLTRDTQRFNELGEKILRSAYPVDGQDFDAIAETIQRVFIDGNDYKAVERREVFDKYLNYPKAGGMLASEFIYGSIADGLKEVSE